MDGGPIDGIRGASMVQTDAMYQVWISKLYIPPEFQKEFVNFRIFEA